MATWSPYAALYYPYASFGHEKWLREAVLSWDSVGIIRPPAVETSLPPYGPMESLLIKEAPEFVDFMTPKDEELVPLHISVADSVDQEDFWEDMDREYGRAARDRLPLSTAAGRESAPAGADPRLVWIMAQPGSGKMHYVLADELLERDLADVFHDRHRTRWLGLHPTFAAIYLTSVAGQMAANRGLVALTDDPAVHRAAGPVALQSISQALTRGGNLGATQLREVEAQYLHVALREIPTVADIEQVPPPKLLEFRQTHLPQMRAFRQHVASLESQLTALASVTDIDARQDRLRELYRNETRPQLDELRASLKGFGFRTALGTLQLKIELGASTVAGAAATTAANAVAGVPAAAVTGSLGLAMAVIPYLVGRRSRRTALQNEPTAFLLAAERELDADRALGDMR